MQALQSPSNLPHMPLVYAQSLGRLSAVTCRYPTINVEYPSRLCKAHGWVGAQLSRWSVARLKSTLRAECSQRQSLLMQSSIKGFYRGSAERVQPRTLSCGPLSEQHHATRAVAGAAMGGTTWLYVTVNCGLCYLPRDPASAFRNSVCNIVAFLIYQMD